LERVNTQEEITVEALLDSGVTGLVMSSKFARRQGFMLWQPLVTKTNDYTSGKSLNMDIKWEVYKRNQQEVSAKLESYLCCSNHSPERHL